MVKRILQITALVLFLGFVAIQFIRPDFTNPPINPAETLESSTQVPENVEKILTRSCNDCHTNATIYPWYSKIQPSAFFLKGHIDEGRGRLNFSTWNTNDAGKKRRKLGQVCEQIQSKEMPLPSYLWVHWDAKLSDEDIKIICGWTEAERAKLDAAETPTAK